MSWTALVLMAAGTWLQKAVGPVFAHGWSPGERARAVLLLLAVPVLAGLIVVQTVSDGRELVLDARAPALLAAAIAVWRGAPFIVTVGVAAVVAAGTRLVT